MILAKVNTKTWVLAAIKKARFFPPIISRSIKQINSENQNGEVVMQWG